MTNSENERPIVNQIADAVGGTIEDVQRLPDGSGYAVVSMPLPKDHWLMADPEKFNVPPMPMRIGTDQQEERDKWKKMLVAAGRYAVRCATMNGQENDFDPDALIQNLVVGFLGYNTPDGYSDEKWCNPPKEDR